MTAGRHEYRPGDPEHAQVLKVAGGDIELGNSLTVLAGHAGTGGLAAQLLLREIDGVAADPYEAGSPGDSLAAGVGGLLMTEPVPAGAFAAGSSYDAQDRLRRFLPANGGCAYIDLDHLELCLPEVVSASDHVAAWHAMLRVARQAQVRAGAKLPGGVKIQVLVNNSDGIGHSYGSHLNLLITRQAAQNLFQRKLHYLLYLATFQVSSIVITGQGKVGAENGQPETGFQISQRADFFETLVGPQTTYHRPLVNSRDEAHCGTPTRGDPGGLARLHCIFFDNGLAHTAAYLKVGCMQVILAMIEAGALDVGLTLDDPVSAVHAYSRDPDLRATAPLITGEPVTALELQRRFLADARRFAEAGGLDDAVPGWQDILACWEDVLAMLARGDAVEMARHLDWPLKRLIIERTLADHPELAWRSPEIKHLDQVYGSLDPAEGLYFAFERAGFTTQLIPEERIARFVDNPPEDTRAWTRAMTLRRARRGMVELVDWDTIRFRHPDWRRPQDVRVLDLDDPRAFTRQDTEAKFRGTEGLDELLIALRAEVRTVARRRDDDADRRNRLPADTSSGSSGPCNDHRSPRDGESRGGCHE